MTNDYPLNSADGRRKLEHAIVDTAREPLVVLDGELRVITASRSFYLAFKVTPDQVEGRLLYELGGGEWNIPALRTLLEKIIPQHTTMEEYEVEHDFPARQVCSSAIAFMRVRRRSRRAIACSRAA
jgi:PAS domain-containing protein